MAKTLLRSLLSCIQPLVMWCVTLARHAILRDEHKEPVSVGSRTRRLVVLTEV